MFERVHRRVLDYFYKKFFSSKNSSLTYGQRREKIYNEILNENERERAIIALDREYGLIDEDSARLKILDLDLSEKKINQMEYEKEVATIRGNPWMNLFVVQEDGDNAIVIIDYNKQFISFLQKNNYDVSVPDRAVKQYVRLLSESFAPELGDGGISFETQVDPLTGVKYRR
jgi:nitrogen regulatory protein PII